MPSAGYAAITETLTPTELSFWEALKKAGESGIARSSLQHLIKGQRDGYYSNNVDVHVKNLRRKLRDSKQHITVDTIRGFGYKMVV